MPVIACPGCGKQYKIAATAAGQVAKCACGKRFRLDGGSSPSATAPPIAKAATSKAAATSVAVATAASKQATLAVAAPVVRVPKLQPAKAAPANDDFWDDTLPVANKPAPVAAAHATGASAQSAMIKSGGPTVTSPAKTDSEAATKKKKKKRGGVKWGFDWGKVVAGGGAFLIFGGITAAMAMTTGRISIYLAVLAAGGLFTMLNGLMGEEGIW